MNNGTEQIFLLNAAPNQSSAPTQRMGAFAPPPSSTQVNLDNVEDFSNVCRLCATITELVMPIFSGQGLENKLNSKIREHLPITVRETDELPLVVCYQCANTLLAWHELVCCCMQADLALHAKLSANKRKNNPHNNVTVKSSSIVQDEMQVKFIPEKSPPASPNCRVLHFEITYRRKKAHNDKQAQNTPVPVKIDTPVGVQMKTTAPVKEDSPVLVKIDTPALVKIGSHLAVITNTPVPVKINTPVPVKMDTTVPSIINKTSVQENEFSDHSDTEGFGPLPESVFEAIEDSQDGQQLPQSAGTSSPAPDTERPKDETIKSDAPQNNNLTNPTIYLENNNNLNNRSAVIEPLTGNCAQRNIGTRNRTVMNILVPPEKTSLPKTSEVNIKQSTDEKGKKHQKTRKCPFCPKEYRASSSYFYHLKHSHERAKEYECEVCGRKVYSKSSLTQHMIIHTSRYDYECSHCKKPFKSKAGLYIHEQTHVGTKSFSCNQCDTRFRWNAQLVRHKARHEAARAHECGACGRAFSVRCDLLRHATTHSKGNFACDKCGRNFAQLRYLKVHTVRQHARQSRKLSK